METEDQDIGRGGIKGVYLPRWDPYSERVYKQHDLSFQRVLDGVGEPSGWRVFAELATGAAKTFGICLYGVALFPLVLIGGAAATARLKYIEAKMRR